MKAAPSRKSSDIRASTASACRTSSSKGFWHARWICLINGRAGFSFDDTHQPCGKNQTHAGMMALNLARFTVNLRLTSLQTSTISCPICSPSRSQSVQIMRMSARRASSLRFWATGLSFCRTPNKVQEEKARRGGKRLHRRCTSLYERRIAGTGHRNAISSPSSRNPAKGSRQNQSRLLRM